MYEKQVKTEIDGFQLSQWQEKLSDCARFLWEYFSGVEESYNWVTVFRGYMNDLELELQERPELSRFENDLIEAFFDVTKDVDETDGCEYAPLRVGFPEEDEDDDYAGDEGLVEIKNGLYLYFARND